MVRDTNKQLHTEFRAEKRTQCCNIENLCDSTIFEYCGCDSWQMHEWIMLKIMQKCSI